MIRKIIFIIFIFISFLTETALCGPAHGIRRIMLDAGHGGADPGAVSAEGFQEKGVALDIAQRVRKALLERGLEVRMTRDSDIFIPLSDRASMANALDTDFFVSIHANASPTPHLRGFEIYHLSEEADDLALALRRSGNSSLTEAILWDLRETENRKESLNLAAQVMASVSGPLESMPQRIRPAEFYVLKWTECPAVLVETGYLSNIQDERLLRSPIYRNKVTQAIVDGIWKFKMDYEATNGFTK